MEERRRSLAIEKGFRAAMKIKDSKVGSVILKDNVKAEEKLDSEIYHIDCQRRRQNEKWSRERHRVLKKHQRQKQTSGSCFTLPPVSKDHNISFTSLYCSREAPRTVDEDDLEIASEVKGANHETHSENDLHDTQSQTKETFIETSLSSIKGSTKSTRTKRKWKQATHKIISRVNKRESILPALVSTELMQRDQYKRDSTKDPRFVKLVAQLVPSFSKMKELEKDEDEASGRVNSTTF